MATERPWKRPLSLPQSDTSNVYGYSTHGTHVGIREEAIGGHRRQPRNAHGRRMWSRTRVDHSRNGRK